MYQWISPWTYWVEEYPVSAHYLPTLISTDYRGHTFPQFTHVCTYIHTYIRTHLEVGTRSSWHGNLLMDHRESISHIGEGSKQTGVDTPVGVGMEGGGKANGMDWYTVHTDVCEETVRVLRCTYCYIHMYVHVWSTHIRTYIGDMLSTCTYVRSLALTSFQSCSCRCHLGEWKHNPPYPEGVE